MILYVTISNQGGMKRIAQDLPRLPGKVFTIVLTEAPLELRSKNVAVVKYSIADTINSPEKIRNIQQTISKLLAGKTFSAMVVDENSYPYVQHLKLPYVYDIHHLGRVAFEAISRDPMVKKLDTLTIFPWALQLELFSYRMLAIERQIVKGAIGYLSNSRNCMRDLKKYYFDIDESKPVLLAPVSSQLKKRKNSARNLKKKIDFYVFSRMHPQKGFQNLLFKNWKPYKLVVRGVDAGIFSTNALKDFKRRGIEVLGWSNDDRQIENELLSARVVLFPAIYEPYGLALKEALSFGCFCVCQKNDSGHEEQVGIGSAGILFDFKSRNAIAELKRLRKGRKSKLKTNLRRKHNLTRQQQWPRIANWVENILCNYPNTTSKG